MAFKNSAFGRPRLMNSLSISLADTVFSIVVELIFLVQGKICTYIIPLAFVGQVEMTSHSYVRGPIDEKLNVYNISCE